ncbi:hypothetical protein [Methylibium sp.]|uniref:hypothetical protein n=1 Tax=Methylibium sp. TaxID=2067992 RepID=UPI0025F43D3C|nr:hypothetical protein [Methylibium sp.]
MSDAQGLDADAAPADTAESAENGERDASRRRRRRGGRGRGERDETLADGSSAGATEESHESGPTVAELGVETSSVQGEGDTGVDPAEAERAEVDGGDEAAGGEPRRRRRGGRGRRDRTEGAVVAEGNVEAPDAEMQASGGEGAATSEAASGDAVTGDALGSETVRAATPTPVEPVMPVAEAAVPPAFTALELPSQPSATKPVATAVTPSPEPVSAPASAPTPEPAPIAAELAAYELPMNELAAVAEGSGLEWVNTDAQKVRQAQEAMANAPKPAPAPRAPKPVVELDDGPLVLVETRKDLSQVKLPFEGR